MMDTLLTITVYLIFFVTTLGLVAAFVRLVLGPTLADRVVALDMFVILSIAIIALDAILTGQVYFLRAGITLALIGFLGTVAFAYYLRRVDLSE